MPSPSCRISSVYHPQGYLAVAAKSTLERSILSAREWIAAQVTAPRPTKSPAQHVHQAPVRKDTVRCNTDAAWSATTLRTGIGWHFDDPVSGSHTEGTRGLQNGAQGGSSTQNHCDGVTC
ncbi:hypothetical protein IGI04_008803 [Brassica rapa subsp. trilocularis]|uniref:Uncharacterized protein n=1 Tax=Brassica rapa subsp. trilocularis TaxID=1813537 RepID=A0ABQ7MVG7_BRACM|nr:hypothetical protein IGI04_008803 [Brassica rapa subsp. trilocularis]